MPTHPDDDVPSAFPEPAQRFAVNGVELAWDRWGDGPGGELLLCHGFTGSSFDFALQIGALTSELSGTRSVVALDHRGHGLSTKTGTVDGYSIDQLTADLVALADAEAHAPFHLLGHSMGGRIALGFALARPDLVRSLVLMDTTAWSFSPTDPELADLMRGFLAKFDPTRGLPNLDEYRGPEADLIDATTPAAWRARKDALGAGVDPYAYKALGEQLFDTMLEVGDRLGEIRCPTTVIVGANDHPLVDDAPKLVAGIDGARLAIVDGAYHSPQRTHSQRWREAMASHLAWAETGR
jgi:pimeloyl-ACP methyl ester carboxylesterase